MGITDILASTTKEQIDSWNNSPGGAAALTFRGDIYSGLSATQWNKGEALFAQQNLLILSGLYGLLKPFDEIKPYRLEMGYKLKLDETTQLDLYWKEQLASALDVSDTYINLTAKEYFKVIEQQLRGSRVISPKFLTVSKKTGLPVFVTVHAKIARGSLASWLITNKIDSPDQITGYSELNYTYDKTLSTEFEPVFVCREFGGLGLSIRLK
jgi:cytoplasmic iron level regulating protein YaaA (DUF328/UPF0246 family)